MANLPKRWSPLRKMDLLVAIDKGLISEDDVIKTYLITKEELASWRAGFAADGARGLRVTHLQAYRSTRRRQRV